MSSQTVVNSQDQTSEILLGNCLDAGGGAQFNILISRSVILKDFIGDSRKLCNHLSSYNSSEQIGAISLSQGASLTCVPVLMLHVRSGQVPWYDFDFLSVQVFHWHFLSCFSCKIKLPT